MKEVFNTSFEVSLRILIILNIVKIRLSIDRISALDFISIYGKDFEVSKYNLHGNNSYRFSEYTSKRFLISHAIRNLVLMGYIVPYYSKSRFTYSISKTGVLFCESLNDEYAENYTAIAKKAYIKFLDYSDRKLIDTINAYAISVFGGKK